MQTKFKALRIGLIVGSAMGAMPAFAQQAADVATAAPADAAGTEAQNDALAGDIIVTAQRRDESLSRTPVAVAVVSSETLAKAQIVSEQDLRTATPGLTIKAASGSNQLNYAIRGQSVDPFSASRPGVLPYVNEVQIGGAGGASAFYDLQSVQVLKGPQGTLFGRSATGGAVLFTTALPTDDFGGYVSLLGGNYGAKKAEGALNLPIVADTLKARVAGFYSERNGMQRNLFDGGRLGGYERYGLRGSATLEVGALSNTFVADYFHAEGSGMVPVATGIVTGGFPIAALYAGVATPQDRATGIATVQAFLPPAAQGLAPAFYDAYFATPGHPSTGLTQFLADQKARGPYTVSSDALNTYSTKNVILTNRTSIDIGEDTQIRNIIGYTNLKSFNAFETDGTPYGIVQNAVAGGTFDGGATTRTEQFSEELQLNGKTFDGNLTYVVGGYFSDESSFIGNRFVNLDVVLGGIFVNNLSTLKNTTYAGYAQGTYKLNDAGLSVTVGGRYTSEKVRKITLPGSTNRLRLGEPAPAGFSYDKSDTYNKFSWSLGLQNQFDENTLLYAASRRAYKSGSFNTAALPRFGLQNVGGDGVGAEQVTDLELGLKHKDNSGGIPKRVNIAAFHTWIKDRQTLIYALGATGGVTVATVNVPTAKVYGFEIDGQIGPVSGFTVGGSYNYTHARFGSEPVNVINTPPTVFNRYPDTPAHSGSVYAEYAVPVSDSIEVVFHGDVYAQSKSNTYVRNVFNEGSVVPSYMLVNFRVGLNDAEKGWSLTANLKNAFEKTHYIGGLPVGPVIGVNTLIPGEPRVFTLEARINF